MNCCCYELILHNFEIIVFIFLPLLVLFINYKCRRLNFAIMCCFFLNNSLRLNFYRALLSIYMDHLISEGWDLYAAVFIYLSYCFKFIICHTVSVPCTSFLISLNNGSYSHIFIVDTIPANILMPLSARNATDVKLSTLLFYHWFASQWIEQVQYPHLFQI